MTLTRVHTLGGAPTRSESAGRAGSLRDWCAFGLFLAGRAYRTILLVLVLVASVPVLFQWSSYLVHTGSMEPSIAAGDVVVGRPFTAEKRVPVGRVMIFDVPAGPGEEPQVRIHRVVESLGQDRYATAGDANASNDPAPVQREDFRARGILRVPYVGLPVVWLANQQYLRFALWLIVTAFLLYVSFRRTGAGPPNRARHRTPHAEAHGSPARAAVSLGSLLLAILLPTVATASFNSTTVNGSNSWRAAAVLLQRYTAAVNTDAPYAFYRLDEASGPSAADSSGRGRTGTYTSISAFRQSGALPNNPGFAVTLNRSSGRMVAGGTGLTDPTTFSVELWFKTTTSVGGKLIGFESSRNQTSTYFDREAFMRTDGRVVYVGGASTTKLLVSPTALNNGAWHHLVVTAVPSGSNEVTAMYVDGSLVASGNTAKASVAYTGWWRVGYGRVPVGSGYPSSGNFTGTVDDAAMYTTQLSAARVAAHYAAR